MMHLVLLAGLGVASFALASSTRPKLPPGERPFDAFPAGVDGSAPLAKQVVTTSSTRKYLVTSFAASDGRIYYVCEKKGDVDWISYLAAPDSPARELWAANADKHEDIADMQRDFDLSGTTDRVYA